MQRTLVLCALMAAGGMALAAAHPPPQQPETKIVRIQTLNVRDILYVLTGGGGNSIALMRDDGVVLIDTKLTGVGLHIPYRVLHVFRGRRVLVLG